MSGSNTLMFSDLVLAFCFFSISLTVFMLIVFVESVTGVVLCSLLGFLKSALLVVSGLAGMRMVMPIFSPSASSGFMSSMSSCFTPYCRLMPYMVSFGITICSTL